MSTSMAVDTVRLVELAKAGQSTAFDALVWRFQRAVYAVAFAVVADREAALDVLQDSLIAAYRQLGNLDDPSKFGQWVCAIARNVAKQYLRSKKRRHAHEYPLQDAGDLAAPSLTSDAIDQIREALSLLTESQADTVALFYMEGYSVRECAHLQGVPEGTVKRRLHEARQRLKKELTTMVKEKLKEFALPVDYHAVIDMHSRLMSCRTTLAWFDNRWVIVWQDGSVWGKEFWACGPFTYWLAESEEGRIWSTPRQLDLVALPYPDARNLHLEQSFVHNGRLYLLSSMHGNGVDLYSSVDLEQWTAHSRLCIPGMGRAAIFGNGQYLYLTYPSWVEYAEVRGDRVDLMRSADGGNRWQWCKSPAWPQQGITDAAGLAVGNRIYLAWRGHARNTDTPKEQLPQQVNLIWSDDHGASWSDPLVVEPLTIEKRASYTLRLASSGDMLVIAQEVWDEPGKVSEIWAVVSHDGGQTWPRKAIYNAGSLLDPAIAFAPDGALVLAASSRTDDRSQPWFIRSGIAHDVRRR